MTLFSKQVTSQLTLIMEARGFKKVGTLDPLAQSDSATCERINTKVKLILQLHPYDYPHIGNWLQLFSELDIVIDRLLSSEECDIEESINRICRDIDQAS